MAGMLFAVLWGLRKHPFVNGWLFSLYLVFNGAERFLIEQIRVNVETSFLGMTVTQAEIISVVLIIAGVIGLVLTRGRRVDAEVGAERPQAPASRPPST
jgi:phosphatidylglycerol---prolipoprotein diacylglyceryl transferase